MLDEFSWVQIVITSLVIVMLFRSVRSFVYREERKTMTKVLLSIFVWSGALLFVLEPSSARFISGKLQLGENLNTLIFFGFIILFFLVFKLLSIIERIERDISGIVRHGSLRDLEYKEKDK